jgi:hypothetical protein
MDSVISSRSHFSAFAKIPTLKILYLVPTSTSSSGAEAVANASTAIRSDCSYAVFSDPTQIHSRSLNAGLNYGQANTRLSEHHQLLRIYNNAGKSLLTQSKVDA